MKTFTQFNENMSVTADVNPGNNVALGVMNHYTPIENIITNVRNLFCPILGCVVAQGEDGVSIKLHSTKFVNKEEISKVIYQPVFNHLSLHDYVMQQGLTLVKMFALGQYWIVYFSPVDMPQATATTPASTFSDAPCTVTCPNCACEEMQEMNIEDVELETIIKEGDDDEEMEDATKKKIEELIDSKDKVKAAKQLELLVGKEMELPREYYFAGVKSKAGEESIALRWKYTKRASKKTTTEITKSLVNIFGKGEDAVFVADFDKDSMFQLPDEVKKLIENLLELLGAEKTNDPCVFKIGSDEKKDDEKTDKSSDEGNDNSKDDDNEDDDSRGDESDDLLK